MNTTGVDYMILWSLGKISELNAKIQHFIAQTNMALNYVAISDIPSGLSYYCDILEQFS